MARISSPSRACSPPKTVAVVGQAGEQALQQGRQQEQHPRQDDRAAARPRDQGQDEDDERAAGHAEPESAVRAERAVYRAPVGDGEDTETSQENLGGPGQQEGKQQPPVTGQRDAPDPGQCGRAAGLDGGSHQVLL